MLRVKCTLHFFPKFPLIPSHISKLCRKEKAHPSHTRHPNPPTLKVQRQWFERFFRNDNSFLVRISKQQFQGD